MTPTERIDELLRTELRRADNLAVPDRYAAVVARSQQRTRRRWAGASVTVVVLAAGIVGGVTAGMNLAHNDQTAPAATREAQLRGTWTRDIDGKPWTITFSRGAVLTIDPPAGFQEATDGASYATTSSTVRLDAFTNGSCYELAPGTYQWTLSGDTLLQLQADDETCAARRNVFDGAWTANP